MPLILKVVLLCLALTGGLADLRARLIPNWLNLSGMIVGIGLNAFLFQGAGFRLALLGFGFALLIYVPLYFIRAMGAGDVKMMAAIGSLVGPEAWFVIFLATAILGGVASLGLVIARDRLALTVSNVSTIANELFHGRLPYHKDPTLDVHDKHALGLPHGTLIAVAVMIYLLFWAK